MRFCWCLGLLLAKKMACWHSNSSFAIKRLPRTEAELSQLTKGFAIPPNGRVVVLKSLLGPSEPVL